MHVQNRMLGLLEFAHLTYNKTGLIDFLIQHGILANTVKCNQCDKDVNIDKESLTYRCRKRHYVKNVHKKRVSKQCNFNRSAKTDTWFYKSHLDVAIICKIVACFLMLRHPCEDDTKDETGVTSATIVDWFSFCREVIIS